MELLKTPKNNENKITVQFSFKEWQEICTALQKQRVTETIGDKLLSINQQLRLQKSYGNRT